MEVFTFYDVLAEPDVLFEMGALVLLLGLVFVFALAVVFFPGPPQPERESTPPAEPKYPAWLLRAKKVVGFVGFVVCLSLGLMGWFEFAVGWRAGFPLAAHFWMVIFLILWDPVPTTSGPSSPFRPTWPVRLIALLVAAAMGFIGYQIVSRLLVWRPEVLRCQEWTRNEQYEIVEGPIVRFTPDKMNARFRVADRDFGLGRDLPPGMFAGGDIRYGRVFSWRWGQVRLKEGMPVRVWHHDGLILRIEVELN